MLEKMDARLAKKSLKTLYFNVIYADFIGEIAKEKPINKPLKKVWPIKLHNNKIS